MSFSYNVLPHPPTPNHTLPLGETAAPASAKKATQGPTPTPPSGQRPITGELRKTAAGGQEAPDGCQESCICSTKLSNRECRQHRDLHPRGPDEAMRTPHNLKPLAREVHALEAVAHDVSAWMCFPCLLLKFINTSCAVEHTFPLFECDQPQLTGI